MKRWPRRPRRKKQRSLRFETLAARRMLAIQPWTIDFGSGGYGGGLDLFGDNAGGMLQGDFHGNNPGSGGTVSTSNMPGQNNLAPSATDDAPSTANAPQVQADVAATNIAATLLSNDTDPDGDSLHVSGVSNLNALIGEVTFNSGQVLYDPHGQFDSLPQGVVATDTFSYTICDSKGATSTASVAVQITGVNDAPTISGAAEVTVEEGHTAQLSGTYADPDSGDSVALSASHGKLIDNGDGTWDWSLDTQDGPDDGQEVTLTIQDALGETTTHTFQLNVNNSAPSISADSGSVSVNEGEQAVNLGAFHDPGDDSVVLSASVGTVVDSGNGLWEWSFAAADGTADSQDVTITATDSDGAQSQTVFELTVNNVAPALSADSFSSITVNEGNSASLSGTISDVESDTITLSASVGTVVNNGDGTWSWSWDSSDGPDESQQVTITATDSDEASSAVTFDLTVQNVAPSIAAENDSVSVNEGSAATNSGTFGDVGNDSVTLTASAGVVVDQGSGVWSWSFDAADGPDDSQDVTITATDSDGSHSNVTFALTVNNVSPELSADSLTVTVDEGQTATNQGTLKDLGGDSVTLSASVGAIHDNGNGTWNWTLDTTDGDGQTQQVTITATDSDSATTTMNFNLTVNNVAPVAADHSFSATGNVPIEFSKSDLIAGATDAGNDSITINSVDSSSTQGGSIVVDDHDSDVYIYTPAAGFEGTDTFNFTIIDDDGSSASGTVTVQVSDMIWFIDNSASAGGDGTLNAPLPSFAEINIGGARDVDGPAGDDANDIIFVFTGSGAYDVSHGVPDVHDSGFELEDGQILIGAGATGDSLESLLSELGIQVASSSQTLPAINAGESPHITNTTGDVITVSNGNTIMGVTLDPVASAGVAGDDVSGLTIEFVVIITSGGTNNNEGIDISGATGTLTISNVQIGSDENGSNDGTGIKITGGTASFTFENVDIDQLGGSLITIVNTSGSSIQFDEQSSLTLSGSDQVGITISANTDGSVTLNIPTENLNLDTSGNGFDLSNNQGVTTTTPVNDAPWFTLGSDVTVQEADAPDGQTELAVENFATGITVGPQDEADAGQQILGFTLTVLSNAGMFASGGEPVIDEFGKLTFTPSANAEGSAEIKVALQDDGGTTNGGQDTAYDTFWISIPVNEPPSFTIAENPPAALEDSGPQTVAGFVSSISAGPEDEADQSLLGFQVTGNSNPGLFASAPVIDAIGNLTYTPAANAHGSATITVALQDDGGTANGGTDTSVPQSFEITISPVNDAPSINAPASATVVEDVATVIAGVSVGDIDADELTVTLQVDSGTLQISTSVSGGLTAGDVATNDGATVTFTGTPAEINATLGDAAGLTFTTAQDATASVQLTINVNDNGQTGADPGTVEGLEDTGDTDNEQANATVLLHVTPINDPPQLDAIAAKSVDELSELTFTATVTDPDVGDTFQFSLVNAPQGATISSGGEFSWMPDESQGPGTYQFDVVVTDDGNPAQSDSTTVTVTVGEVNVAPILATIGNQAVTEGESLTFTAAASDVDQPAQTLTFSLSGAPEGATITSGGAFSWTPTELQSGEFTFTVTVTDDGAAPRSDSETITVQVNPVNHAPVLAAIGDQTISEGQTLSFLATAADIDQPSSELTFSLNGAPEGAAISPSGQFFWTPTESQAPGTYVFEVIVTDSGSPQLSDSQSISVTVAEVNQAPTLDSISNQSVSAGETVMFTATATDPDIPANTLVFTLAGDVPAGVFITTSGEFSWTPTSQQVGTHMFDVVVTDLAGQGLSDQQTITLTVTEDVEPGAPQGAVELSFFEAFLGEDDPFYDFNIDLDVGQDDRVTEATRAYVLLPGAQELVEIELFDGYGWFSTEAQEDQSLDEFVSEFDGEFRFLIDFDGDFQSNGEEATDAVFVVTTDLSSLDGTAFPDTPEITSPAHEASLDASQRQPTIEWINHAGANADGVNLQVMTLENDFATLLYTDLPHDATSFQSPMLPTTTGPLVVAVDAEKSFEVVSEAAAASGFATLQIDTVWLSFVSANGVIFGIETETAAVDAENLSGTVGGEAGTPGGVAFDFESVSTSGEFSAEYHTLESFEVGEAIYGPAWYASLASFGLTGDVPQFWSVDFTGGFDEVELTFTYDPSLFADNDPHDSFALPDFDIEPYLFIYHFDEQSGLWERLQVTDFSLADNTLTVTTDSLSPFALGYDLSAPPREDSEEPQAEVYTSSALEFTRIELDGDIINSAYLDFEIGGSLVGYQTVIYARSPGSGTFELLDGAWGYGEIEFEQGEQQSFSDLVAQIDGEWTYLVDFNGDFHSVGQQEDDGIFRLDYDLAEFTESDLLSAANITSPQDGAELDEADGRTTLIEWDSHAETDEFIVGALVVDGDGMYDFFEENLPSSQTSLMTPELPSDSDLLAFVGVTRQLSPVVSQHEDDTTPLNGFEFNVTTFTGNFFHTAPAAATSVAAGTSSGSYAGGAAEPGGVEYEVTNLAADAHLVAEFFATEYEDGQSFLVGGDERFYALLDTPWVRLAGEDVLQVWLTELTDAGSGSPATFEQVELTFAYVESALDSSVATMAEIESHLQIFQWNEQDAEWQPAEIVERDADANTITIVADEFSAFVLGWGPDDLQLSANENVDEASSHALQSTSLYVDLYAIRTANFGEFVTAVSYGDFDGDGDIDIFMAPGDGTANTTPAELYLNDGNGNFALDTDFFDGNPPEMVHPRKALTGDFNGDTKPDIFVLGHGYSEPPYAGESPYVILSTETGFALGTGLDEFAGFFHGGAAADIDADGDLDVLVASHEPFFLINDGTGSFTRDLTRIGGLSNQAFFTAELVDVDGDGFVDIVAAGHEENGFATQILWGDSTGFYSPDNSTELVSVPGHGIVVDIDIADLDADGHKDIVVNRTGDGTGTSSPYAGYFVQILEGLGNRTFADATSSWITSSSNPFGNWIDWIRIADFDTDGDPDIVVDDAARGLFWLNDGDGNFSQPAPLMAAATTSGTESVTSAAAVSPAEIELIAAEALRRLADAGFSEAQQSELQGTLIQIADLPGKILGLATAGGILIDIDAAGHGWFVDETPADDSEFLFNAPDSEVNRRIDLLSVVLHEMGHLLGEAHSHDPSDWLHEDLAPGERRTVDNGHFEDLDDELLNLLAEDQLNLPAHSDWE